MGGGLSFIALPLGLLFLFSGFLVNACQVLSVLLLLPFSRNAYRIANMIMMEALWSELVWMLDWWAGVEVRVYADGETWKHMGKEHALLICNHRSDIDWLVGWVIAQVIGWSMWFSEYVFLSRDWKEDEKKLEKGFQDLIGFPRPLWVALFVEGTRFTKAKLATSQEFATSKGLRVPRNVLIPRTKGFTSAVKNLRGFVPVVYDMTCAVSKDAPDPTMLRILKGQPSVVHVHVRRVPMEQLPQSDDDIGKWCLEAFYTKDTLLDQHEKENTFGENLYHPVPRPFRPLLFVIGWSCLLLTAATWLLKPLLSTWSGVASIAGVLLIVIVFIQVKVLPGILGEVESIMDNTLNAMQ